MYMPNMQNVPQFQEKNEVNLTASPQNVQLAWAYSENMGVLGNYFRRSLSVESDNGDRIKIANTLLEGGTGYYKYTKDGMTFSSFGGMGFGESEYTYQIPSTPSLNERFKADLFRFFLQGSIGYVAGKDNINIAFTARYANAAFSNIDTNNLKKQDLRRRRIDNLEKQNFNFIEPGITFRAGFKYIRAHSQLVYSGKLEDRSLNYFPINLNIGLTLDLRAIYNKITGKENLEEGL